MKKREGTLYRSCSTRRKKWDGSGTGTGRRKAEGKGKGEN